jgi:hypothetical protein
MNLGIHIIKEFAIFEGVDFVFFSCTYHMPYHLKGSHCTKSNEKPTACGESKGWYFVPNPRCFLHVLILVLTYQTSFISRNGHRTYHILMASVFISVKKPQIISGRFFSKPSLTKK